MSVKYYAVRAGRKPGIYNTWDECKAQVDGFGGAKYKSFKSIAEAEDFINEGKEENGLKTQEGVMIAYVDGSYEHSIETFSYGMIAFTGDEVIRDNKAFANDPLASMRNVAGEIKGSEAAMMLALEKNCHTLHIYHDYEGIAKWPLGQWKTNKEGTIAYKEFYDSVKDRLNIHFHKVTGHSGDKYNDEADKLAKKAIGDSL